MAASRPSPHSPYGGSSTGNTHSSSSGGFSGVAPPSPAAPAPSSVVLQPWASISGTITTASTHTGGSSLRIRLPTTSTGGVCSIDRAAREPPIANMTPIAGKATLSHAHPTVW